MIDIEDLARGIFNEILTKPYVLLRPIERFPRPLLGRIDIEDTLQPTRITDLMEDGKS